MLDVMTSVFDSSSCYVFCELDVMLDVMTSVFDSSSCYVFCSVSIMFPYLCQSLFWETKDYVDCTSVIEQIVTPQIYPINYTENQSINSKQVHLRYHIFVISKTFTAYFPSYRYIAQEFKTIIKSLLKKSLCLNSIINSQRNHQTS